MNRLTLSALALTLFSAAQAQTAIQSAFDATRTSSNSIYLVLRGTDDRNGGSRFRAELCFTENTTLKAYINEYRGPISMSDASLPLKRTIVADGTLVWNYDPARNEYSTRQYGRYDGSIPTNYRRDFFRNLSAEASAEGAPAARLVNEIYGGTAARSLPWMPSTTAPAELFSNTNDDITGVTYTPVPGERFFYVFSSNSDRSVCYHLSNTGVVDVLTDLFANERFGSAVRRYRINVQLNPTVQPTWFDYTPPVGARARIGGN
jgi:hypothetical protein